MPDPTPEETAIVKLNALTTPLAEMETTLPDLTETRNVVDLMRKVAEIKVLHAAVIAENT